ncbi:unnamed protein product [Cladocopium goreaui]|uniref:FAD-dependent oxidoreductase domain-containing protein 1 n=1 Tax=Cladocopium goreaui TaxID=2562237 RepID=A0A9P1G5U1_9DINO|nr:unnamed protein product [Cladocopium goreaui]
MLQHGPPTSLVATNNSILPEADLEDRHFCPRFSIVFPVAWSSAVLRPILSVLSSGFCRSPYPSLGPLHAPAKVFQPCKRWDNESRVARKVRAYLTKTKLGLLFGCRRRAHIQTEHGEALHAVHCTARKQLLIWLRDKWAAQRMAARNEHGHAKRQRWRASFAQADRPQILRDMLPQIPVKFARAARDLLAGWHVEEPIVNEPSPQAYKGTGTMFRYSGSFSMIEHQPSLDLLAAGPSVDIDLLSAGLRRNAPQVLAIWDDFQSWMTELGNKYRFERVSTALELHTEVTLQRRVPSIHLHMMFDTRDSAAMRALAPYLPGPCTRMLRPGRQVHLSGQSLAFRGCKPHISLDSSQARGRSVRRALDQGHFYLQVEKKGSIFRQTTCPAYQTFTVSPDWVTGLWQGDKINKECAEQHYVQCKRNIRAYCENLKYHGQKQRELYIQQQQAAAAELLRPLQKEPVELPEVTQLFLPQFTRPMHRRKFLVLNGPTRLGKTVYARSLFGADHTYETNCSGVLEPDMREYDVLGHRCVVFDEASVHLVLKHKKLFQAPPAEISLGHSATGMYVYRIWVWNVALIVTSNVWTTELEQLAAEDREWLEGNAILIQCSQPLYRQD